MNDEDDFDYEPELTRKEHMLLLASRAFPYAVGIITLFILIFGVCRFAARIEDPAGRNQWHATVDSAMNGLKNPNARQ